MGKASGNPVCDVDFCGTRGKGYTCDASKFDPKSEFQYRMLSPSPLFPDGVASEFGDLSGMAGPILGSESMQSKKVTTEVHTGKAAMSASFGEITRDNIEAPCSFGSLA